MSSIQRDASFADWLSKAILDSDESVCASMLFDRDGTYLANASLEGSDPDFGTSMIVRLPRYGLQVYVRVESEADADRVFRKVTTLGDVGSIVPR